MDKYVPSEIEPKWQIKWEESKLYRAEDFSSKPKKYILIEFPYPSGERLHVGHGRSYTALDALCRKYRMGGFNVLYPIGWDAFGLPAENYAIKTGINPTITTAENIKNAKAQAKSWGLSFDWSREIKTTDPQYYQWTQWIFLKLLEKDLAYQAEVPVNWCPFCKTNLADEEVLADGKHERCGNKTKKRLQRQWLLKITAYADRLLEDLKTVNYLPKIARQQINWIGRSEGVEIDFPISKQKNNLRVFTTAQETIFGATFIVVAPELAKTLLKFVPEERKKKVIKYIETSLKKSELERQAKMKVKTGVDAGFKTINPFSKKEIPVFVADYVLMGYGTGAVMGVPGHDSRDREFARKYNLPIIPVIRLGKTTSYEAKTLKDGFWEHEEIKTKFGDKSELINSGSFNGLTSNQAKKKIEEEIKTKGIGKTVVNYHLRDWVFSRQHYWGEPIPVVYCENCAIIPVPEKDLPVELPALEKYQPTGTGESPLAAVKDWVNTKCPRCGGPARRETDTMPNWAGSNWYYLGYLVANSLKSQNYDIFTENKKIIEYWMPVDLYNGGMEHTTLHLFYSRFIYKFLSDLGVVPGVEPYKRRHSHGVVLGPDGQKMSKSRGNVVNPDEIVKTYGADTYRLYESFMGPFEQMIAWSDEGVEGCYRFLKRVWQLSLTKVSQDKTGENLVRALHKTVKKVGGDIEGLKFNTAVAAMMEFINVWQVDPRGLNKSDLEKFLLILAPFAPYLTEELWQRTNGQNHARSRVNLSIFSHEKRWSIHQQPWPKYDPKLIQEKTVTMLVEINGKVREKLDIGYQISGVRKEVEKLAEASEKTTKYLAGKKVKQIIFIPGKLINFVTNY